MESCVDICIRRILLNKFTSWTYIVAHQHGEDVVGFGRIFNVHLFQNTGFRIHGGFPQLFRVHFTQTFVALGVDALFASVSVFLDEGLTGFVRIAVFTDFSFAAFVQRRSGDVQMSDRKSVV